jgi:type 1 glutamine amidotransferase
VTDALIFSGGGDLGDPWHPFAETSAGLAGILRGMGLDVTVDDRIAGTVEQLRDAPPALLVVNAGNAEQPHPRDAELLAAIGAHAAAGRPLLALHVSATLFPEDPGWEALLGGRWVRGTTFHPEQGIATIEVAEGGHPVVEGLRNFEVDDERYSRLRVNRGTVILARQEYEGERHPLAWAWRAGEADVIYDALGHDAASFASPGHRQLLERAAGWLTRDDSP